MAPSASGVCSGWWARANDSTKREKGMIECAGIMNEDADALKINADDENAGDHGYLSIIE